MNFEKQLNIEKEINELVNQFLIYSKNKGWKKTKTPTIFLRRVDNFFKRKKQVRENILRRTKLHGSDCLTQSILANIIGKRFGFSFEIAVPKNPKKIFHTLLSYKDKEGKTRFYNIAGNSTYRRGKIISNKETITRLRLTKPIIKVVNKIRRR